MESRLTICVGVIWALTVHGGTAQEDVCGKAPLNQKIFGGSNATEGSWPWMASLHSGGFRCGGSLINNLWILTAAHCYKCKNITVYLGRHTQQGLNPNEVNRSVPVDQFIQHPGYKYPCHDDDIALVKLSSPVTFTNYIQPLCLAEHGSIFSADNMTVAGWGRIHDNETDRLPTSWPLQQMQVPIVSNSDCKGHYGTVITDNMICAGDPRGGMNSCPGDSGSPMMVKRDGIWFQAGIVSFGKTCTRPPAVYTRVSQYQSWINEHINSSSNVTSGRSSLFSLLLLSILPLVFSV